MSSLLTLSNAGFSWPGQDALFHSLSLQVREGEIVTLLGPSGCGKSTVLRLAAGLEQVHSGTVQREKGGVGFVFQEATLMPWANAAGNVRLPLRLRGENDMEAVRKALGSVGLADAAGKYPAQLSGGMKMRVAIARALVTDPPLLLMDEPFAALDELTRFRLNDLILDLRASRGVGVLFVTHSLYEAAYLSDRILIMSAKGNGIALEEVVRRETDGWRGSPGFARLVTRLAAHLEASA